MQLKARYYELRVFLALRPMNYIFGRLIRFFGSVRYVPGLGYFVNDPMIARLILGDHEHFSLNEGGGLGALIKEMMGDTPTLLSMDGEDHHRVKYALLDKFSDMALSESVGAELHQLTREMVAELRNGQPVDVAEFTRVCTNRLTAKLLGVTRTNKAELLQTADLVTNTMGCIDLLHQTFTPKNRQKAKAYVDELRRLARSYYEDSNLNPNSLITIIKSLGYDEESTVGFIIMFIIAGTVTVSAALPRIIALLIDTGSLQRIKDDHDSLNKAIDEGLRFVTPGPLLLHGVKSTAQIKGHNFIEGKRIMVLLVNIMHSNKFNPHANTFNVNRQQNSATYGLWFGFGAHFCMGSVLAKLEIETVLRELKKVQNLKIIKRSFYHHGINPGYTSLVIQAK